MIALHEEYVVDEQGKKKSVIIPYEEWQKVVEQLEILDDIALYDKSKKEQTEPVPFEEAVREIKGDYNE